MVISERTRAWGGECRSLTIVWPLSFWVIRPLGRNMIHQRDIWYRAAYHKNIFRVTFSDFRVRLDIFHVIFRRHIKFSCKLFRLLCKLLLPLTFPCKICVHLKRKHALFFTLSLLHLTHCNKNAFSYVSFGLFKRPNSARKTIFTPFCRFVHAFHVRYWLYGVRSSKPPKCRTKYVKYVIIGTSVKINKIAT